jgi:GntR family transcriptional regulator
MEYIHLNPFDREPLYRQLKDAIKKAILSKRLKHQEELPSENTLVSLFDISSTVVKSAYELLENEGLIERIRGKGTFVSHPETIVIQLPFVMASISHMRFDVSNITAVSLEKTSPIWSYFPNAETITKIRRLIKMNDVLTTYQEVFLPNQGRETLHDVVVFKKSLKDVIIGSVTNPKEGKWVNQHGMKKSTHIESSFLNIPLGAPLHKILSSVYDEKNQLIALVFTFIRGELISFKYDRKL